MCASCGCGKLHEEHGNPANITIDEIDKAAKAANISREQCVENMAKSAGVSCRK